jgi:regulator of replication initiation timing
MSRRLNERLANLRERTEENQIYKLSKYSHINANDVIELLGKGLRLPHIAVLYNCSPQTVSRQVRKEIPDFDARNYIKLGRFDITIEDVVDLYMELRSSTQIAKIFGVNTHAITDRLEKAGIKRRPLYREDITAEKVHSLYKEFKTTTEVARVLDISESLVRRRLSEVGITSEFLRKKHRLQKLQRKRADINELQVIKQYNEGWSIMRLSTKYSCSHGTIRRLLVSNGKKIRKR